MKITLGIELTAPGRWGLDMSSRNGGEGKNGGGTLVHAYGEDLTEEQTERKIADAVQRIMAQLEPAHDEFPSSSVGPEAEL